MKNKKAFKVISPGEIFFSLIFVTFLTFCISIESTSSFSTVLIFMFFLTLFLMLFSVIMNSIVALCERLLVKKLILLSKKLVRNINYGRALLFLALKK